MKKRKLLFAIAVMCLAFSMTACGDERSSRDDVETRDEKDDEKDSKKDSKESDDEEEAKGGFFDTEKEEEAIIKEDGTYEAKQEIIDATWDSGLIQINDKILQYPFHLSEWLECGFDYDLGELSKEYLWAPNSMFSINLLVNGQQFSSLSFINTLEDYETVEVIDPLILESGYIFTKPEKYTVYYPGGLTFGDSYEDVQKVFGKPNKGLSYEYGTINSFILGELMYGYYININQNDQTINHIQIAKSMEACNMEDLTTVTYENVPNIQVSEVHNVSLSWFPESMNATFMPLTDNRGAKSVLNYHDQTYFVDFYFGLTAQRYAGDNDYIFYGDPLFDETDENGMRRRLYYTGNNYLAVCSTDLYILEAYLNLVNAIDASEDTYAVLQDFAIEFTKSIQY